MKDDLLKAMLLLAQSGLAADQELVAVEAEHAANPSNDERKMQRLGALSREIWNAHKATRKALAALR